jgi:putative phosphoribosyl transferase
MFKDRTAAGNTLASELTCEQYDNICLLAVPRGGVVVAAPIALKLNTSLGVLVTRKIGHPLNPEVAIGAVMPDGSAIWNQNTLERFNIGQEKLTELIQDEYAEIKRRMLVYTGTNDPPEMVNKTVVIIDDGIATGYTIRAAVQWLKTLQPAKIIIAIPVAPPELIEELREEVDTVICPLQPTDFRAVGMHYKNFSQTTDDEVFRILHDINIKKPG